MIPKIQNIQNFQKIVTYVIHHHHHHHHLFSRYIKLYIHEFHGGLVQRRLVRLLRGTSPNILGTSQASLTALAHAGVEKTLE